MSQEKKAKKELSFEEKLNLFLDENEKVLWYGISTLIFRFYNIISNYRIILHSNQIKQWDFSHHPKEIVTVWEDFFSIDVHAIDWIEIEKMSKKNWNINFFATKFEREIPVIIFYDLYKIQKEQVIQVLTHSFKFNYDKIGRYLERNLF